MSSTPNYWDYLRVPALLPLEPTPLASLLPLQLLLAFVLCQIPARDSVNGGSRDDARVLLTSLAW